MTSSTAFTREIAGEYLESSGKTILDRDWTCTDGILSFVGDDGDTLVVYAVDERNQGDSRRAEITGPHRRRLRNAGLQWMNAHAKLYPRLRIDLITVTKLPMGQSNLEHVEGVG